MSLAVESGYDFPRTRSYPGTSWVGYPSSEIMTNLAPRTVGPDFLCIGQGKAGTGWLYDMLGQDPDFWMPPIKELKYFNDRFPVRKVANLSDRLARRPAQPSRKNRKSRKRPFDDRDRAFVSHAITYKGNEGSIEWYKDLFLPKGNLVSGDITPGYGSLDGDVIGSIARALPHLRLVLLLRDPVSRVWSNFNMQQRAALGRRPREFDNPSADLVSAFRQSTSVEHLAAYLERKRSRSSLFASRIYGNWRRHFDASQISMVFFEDICADPKRVLQKFREDLGLPGAAAVEQRAGASFNRKAGRLKREMSDDAKAVLVDAFRDEMVRCGALFGGPAEDWPRRYGIT